MSIRCTARRAIAPCRPRRRPLPSRSDPSESSESWAQSKMRESGPVRPQAAAGLPTNQRKDPETTPAGPQRSGGHVRNPHAHAHTHTHTRTHTPASSTRNERPARCLQLKNDWDGRAYAPPVGSGPPHVGVPLPRWPAGWPWSEPRRGARRQGICAGGGDGRTGERADWREETQISAGGRKASGFVGAAGANVRRGRRRRPPAAPALPRRRHVRRQPRRHLPLARPLVAATRSASERGK